MCVLCTDCLSVILNAFSREPNSHFLASTVKPPLYNSESINLDHNAQQHAPVE